MDKGIGSGHMDKEELLRYVGNFSQAAGIRLVTCNEGRSAGMKMYEVTNGPLSFQAMCDKALDISALSYKGVNFTFLSKPGLQGRNHYDTNGDEAVRSIMGGLFFTAGFENICAPYEDGTGSYPMHGRIRTTPAENLYSNEEWTGGGFKMTIGGTMREAALFGENLVLRRRIETIFGSKSITVTDEVENEAYRPEPMMLLYHINLGWPFLSPDTRFLIPTAGVTPRDEASLGHETDYYRMEAPKDNEPEYVFIHEMPDKGDGLGMAAAVNSDLKLGLKIEYPLDALPYFMEWKSTASGDYVTGLEPSNSSVYGRGHHVEKGDLHMLEPFGMERISLKFTVLDGDGEIQKTVDEFKKRYPEVRFSGF